MPEDPSIDQPTATPPRPRWLTITRRVVAIALLPVAVGFAAWPVVLLGGYRGHFVLDDGMEPAFRKGSMVILRYRVDLAPEPGKPYGIRIGAAPAQITRVRRVVALPGDRVRLESGRAIVNGEALVEPYVAGEEGPSLPDQDAQRAGVWRRVRADGATVDVPVENGDLVLPESLCLALPDDRKELLDPSEYLVLPTESVAAEVVLPAR